MVPYTKAGWFAYVRSKASTMQGVWTLSDFVVSVDERSAHLYYDDRAIFTNTTSGAAHCAALAYLSYEYHFTLNEDDLMDALWAFSTYSESTCYLYQLHVERLDDIRLKYMSSPSYFLSSQLCTQPAVQPAAVPQFA